MGGLSVAYPKQKEWLLIWKKNSEHFLCHCQTFILFGSYYASPWKTHFLFSPKKQARALEVRSVDVMEERAGENAANVPV